MIKQIIKFTCLIILISHSINASDKSLFESLDKSIFGCIIGFLDIPSIGRVRCLSKSVHSLFEKLENTHKEKHPILNFENLKLFEACISDFENLHKEAQKSISPFAFSTHLIETTKEDKKLHFFMDEFINTLLEDKKSMLLHWQSMLIRKKILKPFLEKIIKKEENQKWNTIFERYLFADDECLETHHPYYILPFVFFLDQGVSMNYGVTSSSHYFGATVVEFAAIACFYDLIVFLLKNGGEVNRFDSTEPCLYLAVWTYMDFKEKSKNCDNAKKSIFLLLRHGASKDHYIVEEEMSIRLYVQKHITDEEILKYFKEEK